MDLRTPIKQARGLGDGGEGIHHWWAHRVTAIALVPLCLWFVYSVVAIVGQGYDVAVAWVSGLWVTVLLLVFLILLFYHSLLGVEVVIEDYVFHKVARTTSLLLNTFLHFVLVAAAIVAVLRISFGA